MTQWRQAPATQREAAPAKRLPLALGYLVEVEPNEYRIAGPGDAPTHRWGFNAVGFVVFAPLSEPTRGMRNVRTGDRLLIYGGFDAD